MVAPGRVLDERLITLRAMVGECSIVVAFPFQIKITFGNKKSLMDHCRYWVCVISITKAFFASLLQRQLNKSPEH